MLGQLGLLRGFTTRAGCLLAAGVTAVICGLLLGEADLLRAGCLAIALPVVAAIVMRRSQLTIGSRRGCEPERVQTGEQVAVQLWITNHSMLPTGALMLEDTLPAGLSGRARFVLDGLSGRESRSVTYRIPGLSRGRHVIGPLRLRSTDPFSMIDLTRSFSATTGLVVTPVVEPLGDDTLARSWGGSQNAGSHAIGAHGADDASTREYRHGDDLRKIHWRTTARTGALMVRHEERPWQGQTTLLLDTRAIAHRSAPTALDGAADPRRHSSFEWAVSCAASIGGQLLRAGRETSLVVEGSANRYPAAAGAELLDQLAMLTPSARPDLTSAIEALRGGARESTVIAVLGHLDPESVRLLSRLYPRGSSTVAFAVALDTSTWGSTWASTDSAAEDPSWPESVAMLRACGWWVVAARSGDSIASVWSALLQQRRGREFGHPGSR